MKKIIILLASFALLTGCASRETLKRLETQSGQGVFQVVEHDGQQPPAGFGDVQVSLNVKTRKAGTVLISTSDYGTDLYHLLIGVNDQTQRVAGSMVEETGVYRGSRDPETGNGVRYRFATTLRLPVGTHQITFALPGDSVVLEQEFMVQQGINQLELKPVYRKRRSHRMIGFLGKRTYYEGVKALTVAGEHN